MAKDKHELTRKKKAKRLDYTKRLISDIRYDAAAAHNFIENSEDDPEA